MIEKAPVTKGRPTGNWMPVNSSPVTGKEFTVPNLPENSEWEFRVVAVNDAGPGKPSKTTGPHKVRDPVCKYFDSPSTSARFSSFNASAKEVIFPPWFVFQQDNSN